jgi:histone acetyltransferase (RNA polymerase elongator complex component)
VGVEAIAFGGKFSFRTPYAFPLAVSPQPGYSSASMEVHMYDYMTVEVGVAHVEAQINQRAKDGWRVVGVCPITPTKKKEGFRVLVVLEKQAGK